MGPRAFRLHRPLSELAALRRWPPGTLVDGELVALREGLPDLASLLSRHALSDPWKIRLAGGWCPVRYVVFDLLYHAGECLLRAPLRNAASGWPRCPARCRWPR